MRTNNLFGTLVLIVFGLFWTILIGVFDFVVVNEIAYQVRSESFLPTIGTITHSEVVRQRGSKGGTTYGVNIQYTYQVADHAFGGHRFRYTTVSSSDSRWARETVARYPVGSEAMVFYDPAKPGDALLSTGLDGADLTLVLFLMPFNLVSLGLMAGLAPWLRGRLLHPVAGGVQILREPTRLRIRLPRVTALAVGLIGVGAASFALIFIVLIVGGPDPAMAIPAMAIAAAWGVGLVAYVWQRGIVNSGDDDLILDAGMRQVGLPMTFQRNERFTIDYADILAVEVETITHNSNKGGVTYTYAPALRVCNREKTERLADWNDPQKADSFATWLREELGLSSGILPVDPR